MSSGHQARMTSTGDRKDETLGMHLESAPGRAPAGRRPFRFDRPGRLPGADRDRNSGRSSRRPLPPGPRKRCPKRSSLATRQARCFARATGSRAKTDAVDARSETGPAPPRWSRAGPRCRPKRNAGSRICRRPGTADAPAHGPAQPPPTSANPCSNSRTRPRSTCSSCHLSAANCRRSADEARARKLEISPPSRPTAAGLLAEMPELGALSGKAAASLAGLAAVPRELGPGLHPGRTGAGATAVHAGGGRPALEPRLGRGVPEARGKPGKVALGLYCARDFRPAWLVAPRATF